MPWMGSKKFDLKGWNKTDLMKFDLEGWNK